MNAKFVVLCMGLMLAASQIASAAEKYDVDLAWGGGGVVSLIVENQGPATWPAGTPPVLAGFTAYRLRLMTNDPMLKITGIDLNGAPERGIFGPLHQRWLYDGDGGYIKSEFKLDQNNVNSYSNDSHFLFTSSMIGTAGVVEEDNPGTGSPRPQGVPGLAYWGVGTKLRAAFWINAPYQSTNLAFAYIVVPDGREAEIHGMMQVVVEYVPEPGTLSILALAGVGLLRRR